MLSVLRSALGGGCGAGAGRGRMRRFEGKSMRRIRARSRVAALVVRAAAPRSRWHRTHSACCVGAAEYCCSRRD